MQLTVNLKNGISASSGSRNFRGRDCRGMAWRACRGRTGRSRTVRYWRCNSSTIWIYRLDAFVWITIRTIAKSMVTGLNVFFWATKLKYFAQQIKRIFRLPLFGRSVHSAWGKAFQWFGSTGPRHMPGGEIQPKISFYQKMQRVDVCTHGQARPAMRNTVSQVPPSPFPSSDVIYRWSPSASHPPPLRR